MKIIKLLGLLLLGLALFASCNDDKESYPTSDNPTIEFDGNVYYSAPNRKFSIKAKLKDDLGLKFLNINIPELNLDKRIDLLDKELLTEYNLSYEFLVPKDFAASDKFNVLFTLADVSENIVETTHELRLDGDFSAPVIKNLRPANGASIFSEDNTKLTLSFDVNDPSGIESVLVQIADLSINELIQVGGEKEYSFNKTYAIPSDLRSYEVAITAVDNFVEPNKRTTKTTFDVVGSLAHIYLVDVAKDTDLSLGGDIFGVPIYYHKKDQDNFVFNYYADQDNKEIYFLGQENSFEPHCLGTSSEGVLENSATTSPIVIPSKGYYTITANPSEGVYSIVPYTPKTQPNTTPVTICGNGVIGAGWDPSNMSMKMSIDPNNPYRLTKEVTLNGLAVAITITGNGWNPFWRVDKNGVAPFNGGANHTYPSSSGVYTLTLDTELERAFLVKKQK